MKKTTIAINTFNLMGNHYTIEEITQIVNDLDTYFGMSIIECLYFMLDNLDGYKIEEENEYIENFCKNHLSKPGERAVYLLDKNGDFANYWDSVYLGAKEEEILLRIIHAIKNHLLRILIPNWDWVIKIEYQEKLYQLDCLVLEVCDEYID